jgi:hypothetical protein
MTHEEQASVLPKAIVSTRKKIRRSVRAHVAVNVASLTENEQKKHEYNSTKAAFLLGAHEQVRVDKLLTNPEHGIEKNE